MITIHLHLPGSPNDLDHGAFALSDGEAISLPSRYCAPDADATLHISNEIAFDAFRWSVVHGYIQPDNIRWRAHDVDTVYRGLINRFGVPTDENGKQYWPWKSPGDNLAEQILMAACRKSKAEREARNKYPLHIVQSGEAAENCKSSGEPEDGSSPVD